MSSVDEALTVCRRMGFARVVVQPYLLFDGVLVKRVIEATRRHAEADPRTQFVTVGHLKAHPLLLRAFEERAHEAAYGSPLMSCDLCKYRVRLIGREADLGLPQEGHHHHARAGGVDGDDHMHGPRPRRAARAAVDDPLNHVWDARLLDRLQLSP
jgi:sirohydrochlorin cobaltochelatase